MDEAAKTGSFYSPREIDFRRTRKLHRHYLYLDAAEVINSLAGIELGQEEQRLRHTLKELGGNAGAKFAVFGMDVNLGGKKRRQLQEELRMKQTVHSAAGSLLKRLEEDGGVAVVRSAEEMPKVFETLTVKFDADLHPIKREADPLPPLSWWDLNVKRQQLEDRAAESREHELGGMRVVGYADVPYGDATGDPKGARVGLQLEARYLMADYDASFCRRATIVGQVMYRPTEFESIRCEQTVDGSQFRVSGSGDDLPEAPDRKLAVARATATEVDRRRRRGPFGWFKKSGPTDHTGDASSNGNEPTSRGTARDASEGAGTAAPDRSTAAPLGEVGVMERPQDAQSATSPIAAATDPDVHKGDDVPTITLVVKPLCIFK